MPATSTARGEPRRLLFVAGSAHPLGGLSTWLDYLLPGLERRGWHPVLGLVEGPRHHRPERVLAAHSHHRWIPIPCRTGTPEGRCRALAKAIEGQRPDVAVGVNIPDLFPALNRVRAAGSTARGLMTVHAIEAELYADAARFRDVIDGVAGTNRLACRLLERIAGIDPRRVFYAPYGVEPAISRGPRTRIGALRVGYAGRLEQPQKRVLDLPLVSGALDRLGIAPAWRVAGTGPAEEGLRRGLPADRTSFLGAVPGPELPARLYREIDALLVPSSWETGPLVVWEAMSAGVPVVASRYVGSALEGALQNGDNALLFDIGDTDDAARQLARLAREPGLAERLVAGGHALVRERYDRTRSLDAWERALEAVLTAPPRAAASAPAVPPATGRLERWLGSALAESARSILGRAGPDTGSGGEWPHAYGAELAGEDFRQRAAELDRPDGVPTCSPR